MSEGKFYGVALGPGDPELITLKGLNILKNSDVIYFPGSISKHGKKSFSLDILNYYDLPYAELKGVYLPMSLDRFQAESVYAKAFADVLADYRMGKKVAFVAEGDITFYSTFAYLLDRIHAEGLCFEMVPGIPAFILAGSRAQVPLTKQDESLLVLSQCDDIRQLSNACDMYATVVLMKPTTLKNDIKTFIAQYKGSFVYAERLGTDQEFICSEPQNIDGREIPYFSIFIFRQ